MPSHTPEVTPPYLFNPILTSILVVMTSSDSNTLSRCRPIMRPFPLRRNRQGRHVSNAIRAEEVFRLSDAGRWLVLCWLMSLLLCLAKEPKASVRPRPTRPAAGSIAGRTPTIRVDVPLVLLNVTVTDPLNRVVPGLDKEQFLVEEDGVPQEIIHFGAEDAALSMGIVFDVSGSVGEKMGKAREAVAEFFRTANSEDDAFLVMFSDRPELVSGFTQRLAEIQNELTFVESKGQTALLDAIYLAVNEMKQAGNPKKALLIVSDGGENSSRYTRRAMKRLIREADVQIYATGIFEPTARTIEELRGPYLLSEICEKTGGRHFPVRNRNQLPDIMLKIAIEIRNQYIVGYAPTNKTNNGKWRRVRVKVKKIRGMPPLRAYFRPGYYAPTR